ncbi:hypothetical protein IWQ60_000690 [Tieghemiomyces parasiticus]|uniref:Uncharacterized protein n=1 Tax=Tieghemiomyces parasiticus TaxID=78921 RepID=A0A9W8ALT0_9FUNG|nr:hypothetical protein IWQ60_000690 [Tieghemiomyces parasiticus]
MAVPNRPNDPSRAQPETERAPASRSLFGSLFNLFSRTEDPGPVLPSPSAIQRLKAEWLMDSEGSQVSGETEDIGSLEGESDSASGSTGSEESSSESGSSVKFNTPEASGRSASTPPSRSPAPLENQDQRQLFTPAQRMYIPRPSATTKNFGAAPPAVPTPTPTATATTSLAAVTSSSNSTPFTVPTPNLPPPPTTAAPSRSHGSFDWTHIIQTHPTSEAWPRSLPRPFPARPPTAAPRPYDTPTELDRRGQRLRNLHPVRSQLTSSSVPFPLEPALGPTTASETPVPVPRLPTLRVETQHTPLDTYLTTNDTVPSPEPHIEHFAGPNLNGWGGPAREVGDPSRRRSNSVDSHSPSVRFHPYGATPSRPYHRSRSRVEASPGRLTQSRPPQPPLARPIGPAKAPPLRPPLGQRDLASKDHVLANPDVKATVSVPAAVVDHAQREASSSTSQSGVLAHPDLSPESAAEKTLRIDKLEREVHELRELLSRVAKDRPLPIPAATTPKRLIPTTGAEPPKPADQPSVTPAFPPPSAPPLPILSTPAGATAAKPIITRSLPLDMRESIRQRAATLQRTSRSANHFSSSATAAADQSSNSKPTPKATTDASVITKTSATTPLVKRWPPPPLPTGAQEATAGKVKMLDMLQEMKHVRLRQTNVCWSPDRTTIIPKHKRKRSPGPASRSGLAAATAAATATTTNATSAGITKVGESRSIALTTGTPSHRVAAGPERLVAGEGGDGPQRKRVCMRNKENQSAVAGAPASTSAAAKARSFFR